MTNVHVFTETREQRNKRIAIEALTLLDRLADGEISEGAVDIELEVMRRRWENRGVIWLRPTRQPYDPDEWLTAAEMAERADVKPATVRRWHLRGHITAVRRYDGAMLFNVGEVVKYHAARTKRA